MNARPALLALLCGLWLPQCIQTSANCQQPKDSHAEQHGEEQRAEGAEVKAGTK